MMKKKAKMIFRFMFFYSCPNIKHLESLLAKDISIFFFILFFLPFHHYLFMNIILNFEFNNLKKLNTKDKQKGNKK